MFIQSYNNNDKTNQRKGNLTGQLIAEGEMLIPWYDEFINLMQIPIQYFNGHACFIEQFKDEVNAFMDIFYNTIDVDRAAQVPPLPPINRNPHSD